MTEEVNQNVVEEVVQPTETDQVQEVSEQPQSPQKGSAEYNFRELRRVVEDQNRRIQDFEYREQQRNAPKQPEQDDYLPGVSNDEILTKAQVAAMNRKFYDDNRRKEEEIRMQQDQSFAEDRVRIRHKDYDDVVTQENIHNLIEDDNVLAETLKYSPNPYETAYKLIKKSAFYADQNRRPSIEAQKIVKNTHKPVSSNAVQQRPLAQANNYAFGADTDRETLYREMTEAAKRR